MKKIILSFAATWCMTSALFAVPASPSPFVYHQPDGSQLTLFTNGDEYYNWLETPDKDIVISNNGYYEYATIVNDSLVPSGIRVSVQPNSEQKNKLSTRAEILNLMHQERETNILRFDSIKRIADSQVEGERSIPLTEGNQKVLCILMGFPDKPFTKTQTDFSNLWNQIGYNYQGSQGSVKDFYLENSYGLLNVTATVVGPYTASHNSSYYDFDTGDFRALMREAMEAARNDVQFSDFDVNENHYVDLVHVVFAGYGKESTSAGVIWSHHSSLITPVWQGLYKAKDYICSPELASYSGTQVAPIGTVCHEYGHDLGAPDYYDTSYSGFKGTGCWDVMCSGSWNGGGGLKNGRCPAQHNPYTKAYIYNWVTPMGINASLSNVNYTLYPSYNLPVIYKINTNTSGEYFLLENKKKLGFNSQIPVVTNDGLLIYHVHSDIESGINNHNVNNSHPQKCYIVNANAASNPNSSPSSYGTNDTLWAYPTNNQIFFTSTSTPSAVSWAGDFTGVEICYIQKNGNNIQFTVNPQIIGPTVLDSIAIFGVSNVPSSAKIKWSYRSQAIPNNPASLQTMFPPVSFVGSDSSSTIIVKREPYFAITLRGDSTDPASEDVMNTMEDFAGDNRGWKYYGGSITLVASISCGGDTINMTKFVAFKKKTYQREREDNEESGLPENIKAISNQEFRLVHPNPVTGTSIPIVVYKANREEVEPVHELYVIEVFDSQQRLIKRESFRSLQTEITLGNLPIGIYYMLLKINGEIKATSKIIKQ